MQSKLLKLLFNMNEEACVSDGQFAYHSVPVSELYDNECVKLISPSDKVIDRITPHCDLQLCAVNPIKGFRRDINVTAHRNFLFEFDDGLLADQFKYVKDIEIPVSACIFSGNKSLHYLLCLENELPSYKIWHFINLWILRILDVADQSLKNPSRSVRIPSVRRHETGKMQEILTYGKRITQNELFDWLSKFPQHKPKNSVQKTISTEKTPERIGSWATKRLKEGISVNTTEGKGRNNTWYAVAMELFINGYQYDEAVTVLEQYFVEELDFKRSEWIIAIKSAFDHTMEMANEK